MASRHNGKRTGKRRDAETEIGRILKLRANYYAVLKVRAARRRAAPPRSTLPHRTHLAVRTNAFGKRNQVTRDAEPGVVKKNYYKLSRLVHPDKTDAEGADDAFKVVSLAYTTLSNPVKKNLYDRYTKDVDVDAPPEDTQSYAEWEANQVKNPIQLPDWLMAILRIPVLGLVVALLLLPALVLLLLFALLIAGFILFFAWCVSLVLCVPCRICCCPDSFVRPDIDEEEQGDEEKGDDNNV